MLHRKQSGARAGTMVLWTTIVVSSVGLGSFPLAGCSGAVSSTDPNLPVDADHDGYTTQVDCDDNNDDVHPGMAEVCDDGVDQDCDGGDEACVACGDALVPSSACICGGARETSGVCCSDAWHADGYCCMGVWQAGFCTGCSDGDDDGYNDALCGGDDCNDAADGVHPGAAEICGDGIDQDCSGLDLACAGDTTAPVLSGGQPTGTLPGGTTQATLRVTTDENATCRWSASAGTAYAAMATTFATTGTNSHSTQVTGLTDNTSYTYFVRCQDSAGNATASDYAVVFSVGGGAGPLTLSLVPSRTAGVAPLSVFFDASGTTDPLVTPRPFHDLEYRWDFDDALGSPVSGTTWATGSGAGVNSRNAAIGPVAGHVFERPGTYQVALSVFDGVNTATAETTITVSDPDTVFAGTNTVCFSTSGTFTDCPAGAIEVTTSSFNAAVTDHALSGTRLLFRRGETFTATASATVLATGPGIIGAFGAGADLPTAKIAADGAYPIIELSGPYTPGIGDWRVMDFDIDGSSVTTSDMVTGIGASGGFNQLLALRVRIHDIFRGIGAGADLLDYWNNNGPSGHTIFDGWAVVDSHITGLPGCFPASHCDWRIYLAGERTTIQGNFLDNQDDGGSHVLRSEYTGKGVISNNTLARAANGTHVLKLHAKEWTTAGVANPGGVGTHTERVVIADNKVEGTQSAWTFSVGPQDGGVDERVRDVILERNWFTSGPGTQVHIETSATDSTIRNNIFDMSGAAYHTAIYIGQRGIEAIPNNDRVYNNTFYSASTGDFEGVNVGTASNITVQNNLACAPLASGPVMLAGTGTGGLVESNNLLHNVPAELFVSATPAAPADFAPRAPPNPACDTGLASVPVLSDFFGTSRPQSGGVDLGAVEGP